MDRSSKVWVLMPLYIYPLMDNPWMPLYDVISEYPDTNFMVVVNPNSGPGDSQLPSDDYVREVPKLNSFHNVCTVGYVRIDWCRRDIEATYKDINLYAGWRNLVNGLYVEGIYVDETPNHVGHDYEQYLNNVTNHIKNVNGLGEQKLVIHNPGTPPEGDLSFFGKPDLVCICEEPFEKYQKDDLQMRLQVYGKGWSRTIYQISGIPLDAIPQVTKELCTRGKFIFATNLDRDFYEDFGASWKKFVETVSKYNSP